MNRRELLTGAAVLAGAGQAHAFGLGKLGAHGGFGSGGALGSSRGVITGLTQANTALFRAVVQGGARNAKVVIWGDSTDRGQTSGGGTTQTANAWPTQMVAKLRTAGFNAGCNNAFGDGGRWGLSATMANVESGDPRITHTGSWTPGSNITCGGFNYQSAAAGSMTFTPQDQVTKAQLFWRDNTAGRSFTWDIDGGAATQVDSTAVDAFRTIALTLGSKASHAIRTTWVLGTPVILGFNAWDDTAGRTEISVFNWGHCGATSASLSSTAFASCSPMNALGTIAPDLTIIEGGIINDRNNAISVATSKTNLTAMVQKALLSGNVILRVPTWDNLTSEATQAPWNAMMYQVAQENGIGIIDITRRSGWRSYADEQANSFVSDFAHPTATGYVDIATVVTSAVVYAAT